MSTCLLGDVLRIFSGDFKAGEMEGKSINITQGCAWNCRSDVHSHAAAIFDIVPSCESVSEHYCSQFFFIFNLIGLPTYPSAYDKFLIIVGSVFNAVTVWYAWNWV